MTIQEVKTIEDREKKIEKLLAQCQGIFFPGELGKANIKAKMAAISKMTQQPSRC